LIRQYELVEKVRSYDPETEESLLDKAYVFSMRAHGTQKRASGDPYFSHPLEVAGILSDMKMDGSTVATGLLHDTIEDTLATHEEIEELFGEEVARLVDGVTKLSLLELTSESTKQAENFRKFFLALSDDIRVLIVKLADRLHNMRTLHHIKKPEKRKSIALETMEIYAPLAERIGMQEMKSELEDLAFTYINPDARDSISARLAFLNEQAGDLRGRVTEALDKTLKEHHIRAQIFGRQKQPYSIWQKMQRQNVGFEQLGDVMGFRILVEDVATCYQTLGIVHGTWQTIPGRFKDYISTPKRNSYQSIHTTVIGPERQRIEIQIRTREMHELATYGVAAHWHYKLYDAKASEQHQRWLGELMEILHQAETPEEFLEHTKIALYADQVFCFSPVGDLIPLPRGATPIDFAYAVHTDVGNTCVGAKINGTLKPLNTELKNGDQIEIVRSMAQTPPVSWEDMVVSGRARSAIRRFHREHGRGEYIALGKRLVERAFSRANYDLKEQTLKPACDALLQKDEDDLFAAVGKGNISAGRVLEALFPGERSKGKKRGNLPTALPGNDEEPILVKGVHAGTAMRLATCCHPLPGDRIVGLVTQGEGVVIHTIDCAALAVVSEDPDLWVDASWDPEAKENFYHLSSIEVRMNNEPGVLGKLATLVGQNQGNITNLKMTDRSIELFTLRIDIEVQDVKHLTDIIAALRALAVVETVERIRG
jgi:GTP diphosphokinase / guanosine-3',5'-bis(diphosphate) 3'-diphosphatase